VRTEIPGAGTDEPSPAGATAETGSAGAGRAGPAAADTGTDEPSPEELEARGRRVFDAVYGEGAGAILDRIGRWHPELPSWLLRDAYGRVLARPGLPLDVREVLGVAFLAALDQPVQLQGHARGALRAGASPERLRDAVERAARWLPAEVAARARERLGRELDGRG
jgi:alkylhydroperoxidase/carboxymuconolactone decarboxylase family protein YurZ